MTWVFVFEDGHSVFDDHNMMEETCRVIATERRVDGVVLFDGIKIWQHDNDNTMITKTFSPKAGTPAADPQEVSEWVSSKLFPDAVGHLIGVYDLQLVGASSEEVRTTYGFQLFGALQSVNASTHAVVNSKLVNGLFSVRQVAEAFNIPAADVHDRSPGFPMAVAESVKALIEA